MSASGCHARGRRRRPPPLYCVSALSTWPPTEPSGMPPQPSCRPLPAARDAFPQVVGATSVVLSATLPPAAGRPLRPGRPPRRCPRDSHHPGRDGEGDHDGGGGGRDATEGRHDGRRKTTRWGGGNDDKGRRRRRGEATTVGGGDDDDGVRDDGGGGR